MALYVINSLIYFDSEAFTLYRAESSEEALRIGAIASRCLSLLLQADGQIVSKRELISGAWGAFGLEVTDNSLAQVVRQLRVALETLQPDHELILTIPRIGYKINPPVALLDAPPLPLPPVSTVSTPATEEPVSPGTQSPPTPGRRHEKLSQLAFGLIALLCWAALFHLPELLRPAALVEQPFVEAGVAQLDGLTLHWEAMPAVALVPGNEQLARRATTLGLAIGMENLHLYRFAGQARSLDLLCQGELTAGSHSCVGVKADE
ncbi:MAG: winged helix-turn-helix domain-containing protein [Pseudomonas sp.]|uniref:winged helix-turn-helix domain-containing protein n=1 Tax=Pseudomonas sp. TaxID=306 RepID=UPI003392C99E